ncbi:uncharacterized protein SRS1_10237 [Sporisorium reilianum f. sp. reilianum]|uniref:Uncharacterized protein n=1 Tax=Sporisorium reilianum f. sp. reilianum TaxID=72559 RepID=A0A2N8U954_9BASI|nr:uncharacterized protein SRS1_10237 [Sporisorium reilianum f. sp. reilianum]
MTDPASTISLASVPDTELDAYIADLILQKSKAKQARSHHQGMAAYLDDDDTSSAAKVPSTNKRFLASVIRNVEGHNQALLRQQAREERSPSASDKRTGTDRDEGPSRLRGWSDDEEDASDGRSAGRSTGNGEDGLGLSSKMDKYFEEGSERARGEARADSHRRSDRHASTKSSSSRHRERSPHESRRDKSKSSRDDRSSRRSEDARSHRSSSTHKSSERHHSHRSSHTERQDGSDDERRRRKRKDNSEHRHREKDRKRSASPPTQPPKKAREWDLGKESLAF